MLYCDSASSTFLHGLSGRIMLNLVRHTNLCIHNSENYMFFELSLLNCSLTSIYQLIIKSMLAFAHRCLLLLWSVKPFYRRMIGETNSSTSSISRIGSKQLCSADQNASPAFWFCSTLEYYPLYVRIVMRTAPTLMNFDVVILLTIITHSSVPCGYNRNVDK